MNSSTFAGYAGAQGYYGPYTIGYDGDYGTAIGYEGAGGVCGVAQAFGPCGPCGCDGVN